MLAIIDEWNAAQAISHLPPELLSHVVAIGIPVAEYFGGGRSAKVYMKTLAVLATISRTWRNAIVGTPSLWGLLSTNLPLHLNRISLERSGSCPLMVEATTWSFEKTLLPANEVLELARPHWDRWSHAFLRPCPGDHILEDLSSPTPSLEVVHVWVEQRDGRDAINLFGGCAPRLQYLRVMNVKVMWDPETFRGLRKLDLWGMGEDFMLPDNFLSVLAANPLLEMLDVKGLVFRSQPPPPPPSIRAPIDLPNLKSILLMRLCTETAASILASIRVPNCESLHLSDLHNSTSSDLVDGDGLFGQSLGHFDGFLRSSLSPHGSSSLALSPHHTSWHCHHLFTGADFSLDIPVGDLHSGTLWVLRVLGPAPDPTHRIRMEIYVEEIDADTLAGLKILAFLPNVGRLKLVGVVDEPQSVILDILGCASSTPGPPTFPNLEELTLPISYDRPHTLRSLEVALKHRYSKSRRGIARARPMRLIFTGQFYRPGCSPLERRRRFDQLCKIRALQGVESVTLQED